MQWEVSGADQSTGEDRTIIVEANDRTQAEQKASRQGLFVSSVQQLMNLDLLPPAPPAPPPPPAPPMRAYGAPSPAARTPHARSSSPEVKRYLSLLIYGYIMEVIGGAVVVIFVALWLLTVMGMTVSSMQDKLPLAAAGAGFAWISLFVLIYVISGISIMAIGCACHAFRDMVQSSQRTAYYARIK